MKSEKKQLNSIKAIIWDMDGVLIDSEAYHRLVEIETLNSFGIPITEDIAKEYLGLRVNEYFETVSKRFNKKIHIKKAVDIHLQNLEKVFIEKVPLVKNAEKVLKRLKKTLKMGLATNAKSKTAKVILDKFSLWKYFNAIIFGEEVNRPKPHPDIFLNVAKKLGVKPKEVVVVEDSTTGFEATKAAGMKLIARKTEHNSHVDFSLADFIVEDLREIPGILEKINSGYNVTL